MKDLLSVRSAPDLASRPHTVRPNLIIFASAVSRPHRQADYQRRPDVAVIGEKTSEACILDPGSVGRGGV